MVEWKHNLCGCFEDLGLCIIAYFAPCYQAGKNAESVGKDCFLYGCLYLFAPCIIGAIVRSRIREEKGIDGSIVGDAVTHIFCPLCALVQEGREVSPTPGPQAIVRA